MGHDEAVAEPVERIGGDAGLDMRRDEVQHLRREPAGFAHALEALGPMELDAALAGRALNHARRRLGDRDSR